ncbi:MAG: tetratricopeptide repeat protein [Flavobacteriales bacterium]
MNLPYPMDSAITIYDKENDAVNLANTLGNKGSVYYMIGSYNLALDYQLRCLEVVEENITTNRA